MCPRWEREPQETLVICMSNKFDRAATCRVDTKPLLSRLLPLAFALIIVMMNPSGSPSDRSWGYWILSLWEYADIWWPFRNQRTDGRLETMQLNWTLPGHNWPDRGDGSEDRVTSDWPRAITELSQNHSTYFAVPLEFTKRKDCNKYRHYVAV